MKKNRIGWILAAGLLGLLGFSSCCPRLRPGRVVEKEDADTLSFPSDTLHFKPDPGEMPIRLMYGVPPTRFEVMERSDDKKTE